MAQTAVSWLMEKLKFIDKNAYGILYNESFEQAKAKEKNNKNFLFGDRTIANACFIKSIVSHKTFINVFFSNNVLEELHLIEGYIKKHCENMLLRGTFSECKLDFDSDKQKNLVLRDYNQINLNEMFEDSWQFYYHKDLLFQSK